MDKPLIIFGAGEIAQVASYLFETNGNRDVAAFTVDPQFADSEVAFGKPLVPFDDITSRYPPSEFDAFVAISYAKMNQTRADKVVALKNAGYQMASYISPLATVLTKSIGSNCFILEDNTIQPFVTIRDNVTLWSGNHIGHHSVIEANVFVSSHVVISGGVTVGNNSFLGVNSTIVDHVKIAPFTFLGAGALVQHDTDPAGIYVPDQAAVKKAVPSTRLRL